MAKHIKVGAARNSKKNRREKLKNAAKNLLLEKREEIEAVAEPVMDKGGETGEIKYTGETTDFGGIKHKEVDGASGAIHEIKGMRKKSTPYHILHEYYTRDGKKGYVANGYNWYEFDIADATKKNYEDYNKDNHAKGGSVKDHVEYLNHYYSEELDEDSAVEQLIYLTNRSRGQHISEEKLREAYREGTLGAILKRYDPIAFNQSKNDNSYAKGGKTGKKTYYGKELTSEGNESVDKLYNDILADHSGQEKIVNDTLHFGVGKPYAYVSDLDDAEVKYEKSKNTLFGNLTDNQQLKEFIAYLMFVHGYLNASDGGEDDKFYGSGGITLEKVGDKIEEFVSKADKKTMYLVHKYGDKFVVLMKKFGGDVQRGSAKVFDKVEDAAEFAKKKAEGIFDDGGEITDLQTAAYEKGGSLHKYFTLGPDEHDLKVGDKVTVDTDSLQSFFEKVPNKKGDILYKMAIRRADQVGTVSERRPYGVDVKFPDDAEWTNFPAVFLTKLPKYDSGGVPPSQDAVINQDIDPLDLQDMDMMAKGGNVDYWIDDAIRHPGRLRRRAAREGLIHGDEKLTEADLHHLEHEGGATAQAAHLAERLRHMHHHHSYAKGGVINQDRQLYRVTDPLGGYIVFRSTSGEKFDEYYDIRGALNKARLFHGKIEKAFPKYGISEGRSHTPFMYFESRDQINKFVKNPDVKIKVWEMNYDKKEWGGPILSSGDVSQPIYAGGGKAKKGEKGKQKYFLEYIMGMTEEDDFEKGQDPSTSRMTMDEKVGKEFDTAQEVLKYLNLHYGFSADKLDYIAFEDSRLEYSRMEDDDGSEVLQGDDKFEEFKEGGARLWAANYSIYVYKMVKEEIPVKQLAKEFGVQEYEEGGAVAEPPVETPPVADASPEVAVAPEPVKTTTEEVAVPTTTEKIARIPNTESAAFTENKVPFIGNELVGRNLSNGDYLVISCNIIPLWLWCAKEQKWYGNNDKPNQAISLQFSQSRPSWEAQLVDNNQMIAKVISSLDSYDLGGIMVKQLFPMSTDNTGIAHSGQTNVTM